MTVDQIIDDVLRAEGAVYTNDPADAGGPTRYGVTLEAWRAYGHPTATAPDIEALTEPQARTFYLHEHFWKPGFNAITDPWVQAFTVDSSVLEGVGTAIKRLQAAVGVATDGVIGPNTLAAVNASNPTDLKRALVTTRMHYLITCALADIPKAQVNATDLKWIRGWWNRVASFL